jgi:hypothetical protein
LLVDSDSEPINTLDKLMQPEKPRLGGAVAIVVFVAVLLAFTIQSDLTTYTQSQLGFKQPYFLL